MTYEAGEGAALSAEREAEIRRSAQYHQQHLADYPELWGGEQHSCLVCRSVSPLLSELDAARTQLAAQQAETERLRAGMRAAIDSYMDLLEDNDASCCDMAVEMHERISALLSGGAEEASDGR